MSETLVMCSPEGFAVNYEINPWMQHQIGLVSSSLAIDQWQMLHEKLATLAGIKKMPPNPAWPDLVFTANAGLPLPGLKTIILSNFRHPQRQGETPINRAWFKSQGWTCIELPPTTIFEGAGDALFDSKGQLWLGAGPRSNETTLDSLAQHLSTPIYTLNLVNPRYYHLDTCFCPLPGSYALYVPESFDEPSRNLMSHHFGSRLIALTPEEGEDFCANAVCLKRVITMNKVSARLKSLLEHLDFQVQETPLSEFIRSGGSAKCLTLSLGELLCT